MLEQFCVKNVFSFKERACLDFRAATKKGTSGEEVKCETVDFFGMRDAKKSERLLKQMYLYGSNASGKSNLLKAMKFFIELIHFGTLSNISERRQMDEISPFLLDGESGDLSSEFEIVMLCNGIKYKYELSINLREEKIIKEKFSQLLLKRGAERGIFERTDNGHLEVQDETLSIFKNRLEKRLPDKTLLLSIVANFIDSAKDFTECIEKIKVCSLRQEVRDGQDYFFQTSYDLALGNPKIQEDMVELLQSVDFGLKKFHAYKRKEDEDETAQKFLQFFHNKKEPDEEVAFSLRMESSGTLQTFALAGIILNAIQNEEIVFIDEFQSSLHPHVQQALVKYIESKNKKSKAQFVFATHDVCLLDKEYVWTDQVWFAEKNKFGESTLASLADYRLRTDKLSYARSYLNGEFGAVPLINSAVFLTED